MGIRKVENGKASSFHQAFGPVLFTGQLFAIMPVEGILAKNVNNVKFKFVSLRTMYSLMSCLFILINFSLFVRYIIKNDNYNIDTISTVLYFLVILLELFFFFRLGTQWPKIIKKWNRKENNFLSDPYRMNFETNLKTKIRFVAFTFMFLALLEDQMNFVATYFTSHLNMQICNTTHSKSFTHVFYKRSHAQIFDVLPINFFTIVWTELMNKTMKFCWSYMDIFIICVSNGIEIRYNQIFKRIAAVRHKVQIAFLIYWINNIDFPILLQDVPSSFWRQIRYDYINICELLEYLDDKFSKIILLACTNDLFYISSQLFNSFQWVFFYLQKCYQGIA